MPNISFAKTEKDLSEILTKIEDRLIVKKDSNTKGRIFYEWNNSTRLEISALELTYYSKSIMNPTSGNTVNIAKSNIVTLADFNEDGSDISDEDKEKNLQANPQTAQNSKKQDAIRAYFNINSAVITAVMNILEQAFNRHFVFLSKLATLNGADPIKKDDNANNNNQNNNQEQQNNA